MDRAFPRFLSLGTIDPACTRFFLVFNYCAVLGLLVHAALVPLFAWHGLGVLASFNVASTALWASALFLNRHGHHRFAVIIALCEVITHSTLAVAELGLESGFQYYLFIAPPLLFFSPLATRQKALLIAIACATLVGLQLYARFDGPTYLLADDTLALLSSANLATAFLVLAAVSYYYHRFVMAAEAALHNSNAELARLASTDALTGLLNRRKMVAELQREAERFLRTCKPFAVLVVDVDDFKRFNDDFGHEAGDYVLKEVASTMGRVTRQVDRLGRWGGEEFLLLLPETDHSGALRVAEKLREAVAQQPFVYGSHRIAPTVTVGVAILQPGEAVDRCILRADSALYRGKKQGKNCVIPAC